VSVPPRVRPHRTHHQVLASVSRTAVLEALRQAGGPLGVADVATTIGLHQNTVRGHLDVLVEAGYAVRRTELPHGPGRPRIVYEATTAPEDGSNYKLIAEVLAEYVASTSADPASAAAAAGRAWAADAQAPASEPEGHADARAVLDGLVRMLADGGFQPEVVDSGDEIHLHHCPFGELAMTHRDVVCGAHLGILQAGVARLGGAPGDVQLIPLRQPHLCITHLDGQLEDQPVEPRRPDSDAPAHDMGRPA
jgi:predicted ArsR family transcriptional regulator